MICAALDHFDACGVEVGRAVALLSMGDLRAQQGRLDEALQWTNQAIELADRLGETVSLALGYQQLGEQWAAQGDEERFEASFSRAFEILADLPEAQADSTARYRRVREARTEEQVGS
jgi:tetratricopeptide (TPR) repeat protein